MRGFHTFRSHQRYVVSLRSLPHPSLFPRSSSQASSRYHCSPYRSLSRLGSDSWLCCKAPRRHPEKRGQRLRKVTPCYWLTLRHYHLIKTLVLCRRTRILIRACHLLLDVWCRPKILRKRNWYIIESCFLFKIIRLKNIATRFHVWRF